MMTPHPLFKTQRGMTLVELMVSLAIGLILLAGVGQVFVTNKRANAYNDSVATVLDNGNFALEFIKQQVSATGYIPNPQNYGKATSNKVTMELGAYGGTLPLNGSDGGAGGNDTIIVSTYTEPGVALVDCVGNAGSSTFVGPAGTGVTNTISIGTGASGRPALFCNGREVIDGIDSMQVKYGVDTDTAANPADGQVDKYLKATDLPVITGGAPDNSNWYRVLTVRVALVVSSQQEIRSANNTTTTFTVLGDTLTFPADKRYRKVYEATIRLHNRCAYNLGANGSTLCS